MKHHLDVHAIFYAPNVHVGGGFVLLKYFLNNLPSNFTIHAFLDLRAKNKLNLSDNIITHWVNPTIWSRMRAEFALKAMATKGLTIFCFHGLPQILSTQARTIVFLQNKLYIDSVDWSTYRITTRVRLLYERAVAKFCRHHASEYIVQTPTMLQAINEWARNLSDKKIRARIFAFANLTHSDTNQSRKDFTYDFIYVADGEAHKNHRTLLKAWELLSREGLNPSLALTLGSRDRALTDEIETAAAKANLKITNLGEMTRFQVIESYKRSRAMIFPSKTESFGLPLLEATNIGLPIIASELDYVRDVCSPVQTFDPNSAMSLARAVKRHLGLPESLVVLQQPSELWNLLIGDHDL